MGRAADEYERAFMKISHRSCASPSIVLCPCSLRMVKNSAGLDETGMSRLKMSIGSAGGARGSSCGSCRADCDHEGGS